MKVMGLSRKLHHLTGLVFSLFLAFHLFNTVCAIFPGWFDRVQDILRQVYQNVAVEVVLLSCLLLHVVLSLQSIFFDSSRQSFASSTLRSKFHKLASYALLCIVGFHFTATRVVTSFQNIRLQFLGLAFTLHHVPFNLMLIYYTLLSLSGFIHMIIGMEIAFVTLFGNFSLRKFGKTNWFFVFVLFVCIMIFVALLSMKGVIYEIPDPYSNDYARHFHEMEKQIVSIFKK